jgi:hypothetical protein
LAKAKRGGLRRELSKMATSSRQPLEEQIYQLLDQEKYAIALQKLQQAMAQNPAQTLPVSEADILLLQGKDDFEKFKYSQAQRTLNKALALGLYDDTYYWLAKSLLAQHKAKEALDLFQTAFDDKTLPKDLGGCYLKLLVLNDKMDRVEALITTQSKRFFMPHIHWARGAIALKSNHPKDALPHFKKMGRPVSVGDRPLLWPAFAYQQAGEWNQAEVALMMGTAGSYDSYFRRSVEQHPAKQELILFQMAHCDRAPSEFFDIENPMMPNRNAAWVLEFLDFIREEDYHEAAHLLLALPAGALIEYRDIKALRHSLMLLAGAQSSLQQETNCAVTFWTEAISETSFDPNLALHLYKNLCLAREQRKALRLLTQLINWVKKTAQQSPQAWPPQRLNETLVRLLCWSADNYASLSQRANVDSSLKQAEQLIPAHPEVVGRRGLEAFYTDKSSKKATELLSQALETGSQYIEVYESLLESLADDTEAVKAIRRKYGKNFGDMTVDTEVQVPVWLEALTSPSYSLLEETVRDEKNPSAPLKALKIFLNAAENKSKGPKITLNQAQAIPEWEALLAAHSPTEQVEIIKAIYFCIQQHAKRNQKGMANLQSSYFAKVIELSSQQVPGADVLHLMLLAVRSLAHERLTTAVASILGRATQPANILASAQLELQRFTQNVQLRPFIEAQLKAEPQNPQLLLANATLYSRNSREFKTFYDQGFEIARRLQDASALKAFREEEWFASQELSRRAIGSRMSRLDDLSQLDILDIIKKMAREAFGSDLPPEVLAQMMPELIAEMDAVFGDDDDFEDVDFFAPLPPQRKAKKGSNRRKFGFG